MLKKITPIAKYIPTKYVDFSEPDVNALNLNKNETALQGVTDKVNETITGIEDLDSPTFEDYTGATQVPTPETALAAINSKSKLSLLFSNIKAFLKGAVTIGMIVNNCATDNPNLPVSAAQAKALMDAVTKLNSEVNFSISNPVLNENIVFVKKGNVVYVSFTGNITPDVASKDIILGNLPESFRPRYNVTQHCIWNNVSNQFVITRSGIVYCYALSAAVQPFRFCIAYLL